RLYLALTFGAKPTVANTNPLRTRVAKMLIRVEGKYKPRIYAGRVILFCAAVPDDRQLADDRGWSEVAEGGVEIHETPGEHATVFDPQNVSTLDKKLDACLRAALSRQAGRPADEMPEHSHRENALAADSLRQISRILPPSVRK